MPYYTVSICATLEASSQEEARTIPLDRICIGKDDPHGLWASAGEAEELPEAEVARIMQFRAALDLALRDSADGVYVEDPRYPGVQFSPQAAAALAALEFEAGTPPVE